MSVWWCRWLRVRLYGRAVGYTGAAGQTVKDRYFKDNFAPKESKWKSLLLILGPVEVSVMITKVAIAKSVLDTEVTRYAVVLKHPLTL